MKKKCVIIFSVLALMLMIIGILFWNGILLFNNPSEEKFPVRGVDVSSYQGEINWDVLSSQNISFAYIKATEGSSFVDENFAYNYEQAQKTSLRSGAYHFFSYDSPGDTQAENFISVVKKYDNMLPPAIDLEFYGEKEKSPSPQKEVRKQLDNMLNKLEEYYGMKPIIYATEKSYDLYLSGAYSEYDIWIRNVIRQPKLSDGRQFTFWQYTNREKLDGYNGKEKYIDMNVFYASEEEFKKYCTT